MMFCLKKAAVKYIMLYVITGVIKRLKQNCGSKEL